MQLKWLYSVDYADTRIIWLEYNFTLQKRHTLQYGARNTEC